MGSLGLTAFAAIVWRMIPNYPLRPCTEHCHTGVVAGCRAHLGSSQTDWRSLRVSLFRTARQLPASPSHKNHRKTGGHIE